MTPLKNIISKKEGKMLIEYINFLCFDPEPNKKGAFNMGFCWRELSKFQCGCSFGWGVFSPYRKKNQIIPYLFHEESSSNIPNCHPLLFSFLFASSWEGKDNTPIGAAGRLRYVYDIGIPDDFYGAFNIKFMSYTYPKI